MRKKLKIEFRYYDKTSCERCASTDKSIKLTLKELKKAMKNSKLEIDLKEKKLSKSKIRFSPTVLINGNDIENILNKNSKSKNNVCPDCCKLVGDSVNCRTFNYKGKSYDYMPKGMILEAIKIMMEK